VKPGIRDALASANLAGSVEGPVYRLGARLPSPGVVAPYTGGETLFAASLTRYEVGRGHAAGERSPPAQRMAASRPEHCHVQQQLEC